jgi:molybdate transport system substrate-binding protein
VIASVAGGILFILASRPEASDFKAATRPTLRVFAAASLAAPLRAIATEASAVELELSFAASNAHEFQIAAGAQVDVFVAATPSAIDRLVARGLLDPETRTEVCENELVAIVPKGGSPVPDLPSLERCERIAVGDRGVPVGDYARESLVKAGLLPKLESKLAAYPDEPSVLTAVANGGPSVGFVYASSLVSHPSRDQVTRAFAVDASLHSRIVYTAAVSARASDRRVARAFLDGFRSESWKKKLGDAGFVVPSAR